MIVMVFCGFMMVVLLFKAISMIVVNPFVYFRSTPPGGTNDFLSSIFCCNSAGDFAHCIQRSLTLPFIYRFCVKKLRQLLNDFS